MCRKKLAKSLLCPAGAKVQFRSLDPSNTMRPAWVIAPHRKTSEPPGFDPGSPDQEK